MAKDYKPRSKTRRSRNGGTSGPGLGTWLGFLLGSLFGASAAVVAVTVFGPAQGLFQRSGDPPGPVGGTAAEETPPEPAADVPTPEFDFYAILPEMEVKVPAWALSEIAEINGAAAGYDGPFVIQVGSFQTFGDADRVKASLALQGLDASIQRVVINGQDVWYRVRLGPFDSRDGLDGIRTRLAQNGMDYLLLRLKDEGG